MLSWGPKYPCNMNTCILVSMVIQGCMYSCFHVVWVKVWPRHTNVAAEIRYWFFGVFFFFFSNVQMWWSCATCSLFPVLSCGLPIKGSTWRAFRDALLHTMVLTNGYLSYHCLSICLNQSAHSLTSGINKAFSLTDLLLTGYFLFFPDNSL